MGYFQYSAYYSVNCCVSDNKAAALIPGAAHDHRAATERSPECADEIGSAARRGCRCGWRPSMMNEAAEFAMVAVVFLLCLCALKNLARPGNRSFTCPGVHCWGRHVSSCCWLILWRHNIVPLDTPPTIAALYHILNDSDLQMKSTFLFSFTANRDSSLPSGSWISSFCFPPKR
jgi:hypothetical protein